MIEEKQHCHQNLISPEAKGKRLTQLRNMANLSRLEICESLGVSLNTYKGWELGRFAGLSVSGAEKMILKIAQDGVIASLDWLLKGEGLGPYVIPSYHQQSNNTSEKDIIFNEINQLNIFYKDIIFTEITDNTMEPAYSQGDMVAGRKVATQEISSLLDKICIIHTKQGHHLVRRLKAGNTPEKYHLYCLNMEGSSQPIQYDVEIEHAAFILRKYTPLQDKN